METQFPITIYINRKNMRNRLYFYIGMLLVTFLGFWIASGEFFTADHYYPKATILLPFGIVVFIALIFIQIKNINDKEPLLILDENGIRYFNRNLKKESRNQYIAWNDITGIEDIVQTHEKMLWIKSENSAMAIEKGMIGYNADDLEALLKRTIVEKQGII